MGIFFPTHPYSSSGLTQKGEMNVFQTAIFEHCEPPGAAHAYALMRARVLSPTSQVFDMLDKQYADCVTRWPNVVFILLLYGPASFYLFLKVREVHRQMQTAVGTITGDAGASELPGSKVYKSVGDVRVWLARIVVIAGLATAVGTIVAAGYFPTVLKLETERLTRQHPAMPVSPNPSPTPLVAATGTAAAPIAATTSSPPTGSAGTQTIVTGAWDVASAMKVAYGAYDPVAGTAFWSDPNLPPTNISTFTPNKAERCR